MNLVCDENNISVNHEEVRLHFSSVELNAVKIDVTLMKGSSLEVHQYLIGYGNDLASFYTWLQKQLNDAFEKHAFFLSGMNESMYPFYSYLYKTGAKVCLEC